MSDEKIHERIERVDPVEDLQVQGDKCRVLQAEMKDPTLSRSARQRKCFKLLRESSRAQEMLNQLLKEALDCFNAIEAMDRGDLLPAMDVVRQAAKRRRKVVKCQS